MSIINGLAALSTSMKQAELQVQLSMKLVRKSLDAQKTFGENTVQLLRTAQVPQAELAIATGKGGLLDVHS